MICPYCNTEMELGSIGQTHVMYPLRWCPEDRGHGLLVDKKRIVKLTALLKGGYIPAHRFEGCKKIIIDENELEV